MKETVCGCKGKGCEYDKGIHHAKESADKAAVERSKKEHILLEPYVCPKISALWHIRKKRNCECGWIGFSYTSKRVAKKAAKKGTQKTRIFHEEYECSLNKGILHTRKVKCKFCVLGGKRVISYASEKAAEKATLEAQSEAKASITFVSIQCHQNSKAWHSVDAREINSQKTSSDESVSSHESFVHPNQSKQSEQQEIGQSKSQSISPIVPSGLSGKNPLDRKINSQKEVSGQNLHNRESFIYSNQPEQLEQESGQSKSQSVFPLVPAGLVGGIYLASRFVPQLVIPGIVVGGIYLAAKYFGGDDKNPKRK